MFKDKNILIKNAFLKSLKLVGITKMLINVIIMIKVY